MKKMRDFVAGTLLLLLLVGCNDINCPEKQEAPLRISIVDDATGLQTPFENLEIYHKDKRDTILSVSMYGIKPNRDSVIYNFQTGLKRLDVFLPVKDSVSRFKLLYALISQDTIMDTLVIFHTNLPNYLSANCPCLMFYHLDSIHYTHHLINGYTFINQNVSNEEEIHLELSY